MFSLRDASASAPSEKPFVEHLDDLRRCVIGAAAWLVGGIVIAIPLAPFTIRLLKWPLVGSNVDPDTFLKVIRVGEGLSVAMQVIFWGGILSALPGIIMSAARFVYPGLTRHERQTVTRSLVAASLLFIVGVAFGYFTTVRVSVLWMLQVNDWLGIHYDFLELADYCGFVLRLLVAFGLVFELPVVVLALASVGLIQVKAMREKRRHVIVALMALAMLLTPPDVMSMLVMSIPLLVLYEACIWIVHARERKAARTRVVR